MSLSPKTLHSSSIDPIINNNTTFSKTQNTIIKQPPYPTYISTLHDDQSSIQDLLDAEAEQALGSDLLVQYRSVPGISLDRHNAVNWMLKVHIHYQFQPQTAYLAVIYLDRFLSSHNLPRSKGWGLQLISVACLSVAAKMEETSVPSLLNLQVSEPTFLFNPKTIQRMELLVMATLKWRLRAITPFDFVHFFISKLSSHFGSSLDSIFSHVSDVLITTSQCIEFLNYRPSIIAVSAVVIATNQSVDDLKLGCFQKIINKDMVKECCHLMKTRHQLKHIEQQKPKLVAIQT